MLTLTIKAGNGLRIGDDIIIKVGKNPKGDPMIGVDAPKGVAVLRAEVKKKEKLLSV